MKPSTLVTMVGRDLTRARGALTTSGFGIAAGSAALVFFLALGLGVRSVLLGDVFPLDRVELEPAAGNDPGLLAVVMGKAKAPSVPVESISELKQVAPLKGVYPKLRFAFPSGAFGGKEIIGRDIGTHEMLADGIDPALVTKDVTGPHAFEDPLKTPGPSCKKDKECGPGLYCEWPNKQPHGQCSKPVPVIVSRYLVEVFNKGIAPAHHLPPIGMSLLTQAQGVTFRFQLGVSMMGKAKQGNARYVQARVVGISPQAIDLGATLPLGVVRRWNAEYAGADSSTSYSSVVLRTENPADVAKLVARGEQLGLAPKDTHARDLSVMVNGVIGLLSLVAAVMLGVAASNIAYTFRVLVADRRAEIGLYRALGATRMTIFSWLFCLALAVGSVGGAMGTLLARLGAVVIDGAAKRYLPDFPFKPASFFVFPGWLWAFGIGFGIVFAALGAISAIRGATKLDPAEALSQG